MLLPFIIVSIIAVFIGIINLIFMIKIAKRTNEIQDEKLLNIDEDTSNILSKFRKITSERMRLLDGKIKIADDVLQDLEDSIENAHSQLNKIEEKINNLQKINTNYKLQNNKSVKFEPSNERNNLEKAEKEKKEIPTKKVSNEEIKMKEPENNQLNKNPIPQDETKSEKIRRLIGEGKTPDEIAKKLKIGIGEVMLVKNLDNN